MLNKHFALAVSLTGIAMTASACSSTGHDIPSTMPTESSSDSSSVAPPTAAGRATGWELNRMGGAERIKAAGLTVQNAEGAAEHFHAHLDVFVDGKPVTVPADIGVSFNAAGKPDGISALHTHDEPGIIHVEAPVVGDTYTLGQFLTEWGILDGTGTPPGSPHSGTVDWSVAVNGQKRDGSISSVVLKAHDEVVLFHGAVPSPLPTEFNFPAGL
jgi:hypothetical protein